MGSRSEAVDHYEIAITVHIVPMNAYSQTVGDVGTLNYSRRIEAKKMVDVTPILAKLEDLNNGPN